MDLSKLSAVALRAAMTSGTENWGTHGSVAAHSLYIEPNKQRRKCYCGCGKYYTHGVFANGVILAGGCEFSCHQWKRKMEAKR